MSTSTHLRCPDCRGKGVLETVFGQDTCDLCSGEGIFDCRPTQGCETFVVMGVYRWNVTAVQRLWLNSRAFRRRCDLQQMRAADLAPVLWTFGVYPEAAAKLPDEALTAPTTPLFVANNDGDRRQIIDGLHRIHAAQERGIETLPVATLPRDVSLAIQFGIEIA